MAEKIYEITNEFHRLDRRVPLTLYRPEEKSPREKVAILAMHGMDFLSFAPMVELAKHGFVSAGANPVNTANDRERLLDDKTAVDVMRSYPGVEKLILIGHSGGGSLMTMYQYIAENGVGRNRREDRIIPFPEVEPLTPGDGMLLLDCNYSIMSALSFDPSVKSLDNGMDRIKELNLFDPDNGYDPAGSHYSQDFIKRFQKAQIKCYQDTVAYAKERYELILQGKGKYVDDEPLIIPGAMNRTYANKLFIQDTSLLSHTRGEYDLLHDGGTITHGVVHTVRKPQPGVDSRFIEGAAVTTVKKFLADEIRFGDFGYDDCSIWGVDWDFVPGSTFANVEGIHVPVLIEGNTAGHEFLAAEYNYEHSASEDKTIVFLEGALHIFFPVDPKYGDTIRTLGNYIAPWIESRFL